MDITRPKVDGGPAHKGAPSPPRAGSSVPAYAVPAFAEKYHGLMSAPCGLMPAALAFKNGWIDESEMLRQVEFWVMQGHLSPDDLDEWSEKWRQNYNDEAPWKNKRKNSGMLVRLDD